jgi:hypothetical protein
MRKSAHDQRPLFGPWLAWEQLPDSVRLQALEVLITLYLETTDPHRIGEQTIHNSSVVENTSSRSQ